MNRLELSRVLFRWEWYAKMRFADFHEQCKEAVGAGIYSLAIAHTRIEFFVKLSNIFRVLLIHGYRQDLPNDHDLRCLIDALKLVRRGAEEKHDRVNSRRKLTHSVAFTKKRECLRGAFDAARCARVNLDSELLHHYGFFILQTHR